MAKTKIIPAGRPAPDSRQDIPPGIDAFLRTLARWTVEDLQHPETTQAVTNTTLSKETVYE